MIPSNYSSGGQQTPSPSNTPAPKAKSSKNPLIPVMIIIGFLMLVAVAWLTYSSISTTRMLEQKVAELAEADRLKTELDNQFNQAVAELETLKGDNEQINAMIEQQKTELAAQKNQISSLLRDQKQFEAARSEIAGIKAKVAQYIADIETLKAEQEQLSQENTSLKEETQNLDGNLKAQTSQNEELKSTKVKLVNDKEELSKAVQVGSVVQVKNIQVTGLKLRKSGKTAEKANAKRVNQLKVCFTTVANDVVQPGNEKFFIRIVSPKGETMAIEDLGNSTTINSKTGEEVPVSQVQEYAYANDETELCFVWKPTTSFQSGKYDVEIYNKGYLAGKGTFSLK